jgi:hypothetical protein
MGQIKFSGRFRNLNSHGTQQSIRKETLRATQLAAGIRGLGKYFFCKSSRWARIPGMRQLLDGDLAEVTEAWPPISTAGSLDGVIHPHRAGDGETSRSIMVVDDYPDLADAAKMVLGWNATNFTRRFTARVSFSRFDWPGYA